MCSRTNLNNLTKLCDYLNGQKVIEYNKLKTGMNDPKLSKAMQYSSYIKTSRSRSIIYNQNVQTAQIYPVNGLSIHNQSSSS